MDKTTKNEFITIADLAKILGISRIAVYKRVKKGQIKAVRAGKVFLIPRSVLGGILGQTLGEKEKNEIAAAVKKTVEEYGEVLRLLGSD